MTPDVKSLRFSYNDLDIDLIEIVQVMGYESGILPPPFDMYLNKAVETARNLTDIRAVYRIVEDISITGTKLVAAGKEFHVNKTICKELKGSQQFVFFICTAGETISNEAAQIFRSDDPVLAYVYDLLGSSIAEAAGNKIQKIIETEVQPKGWKITNRYSPGYCHWNVEDQHTLFSLFNGSTTGIWLTESALMQPIKSISGVTGIGPDVRYREYSCELCAGLNCIYKSIRNRKKGL